ncbi:MAG: class I SAM-dependent methyltransferase [Streptosporangiaceae bacterium]
MSDRLNNLWWETRLGIRTRGVVAVHHPDANHYATLNYRAVGRIIRALDLQPDDVFVDVGSGKGRVLALAARHRVRQVIGIDLSAELCAEARANAARLRGGRTPISVYECSAADFDYTGATVFTLFDPFGAETLQKVLDRIHAGTGGRGLRIAYGNPTKDEIFASRPWLERYDFWDRAETGLDHSIVFYRSTA